MGLCLRRDLRPPSPGDEKVFPIGLDEKSSGDDGPAILQWGSNGLSNLSKLNERKERERERESYLH